MPGIIMDTSGAGNNELAHERPSHESAEDPHTILPSSANLAHDTQQKNGTHHPNHNQQESSTLANNLQDTFDSLPPELVHISQGFFPFGQLVNRSVQNCWNGLTDLITSLADIQDASSQQSERFGLADGAMNGKSSSDQHREVYQKKMRILEFAQERRAEFIKLLVLAQWSRRASDVSKLIDIQAFIRMRYDIYNGAILYVGEMKRDLIRAQMGNPDLKTASQVLLTGKSSLTQKV